MGFLNQKAKTHNALNTHFWIAFRKGGANSPLASVHEMPPPNPLWSQALQKTNCISFMSLPDAGLGELKQHTLCLDQGLSDG